MGAFRLIQSFNDAGRGLSHAFKHEQNFRLQIVASLVVLAATFVFPLKIWEIILIILLCVMVLTMGAFKHGPGKFCRSA